jgi:hypothetical protein
MPIIVPIPIKKPSFVSESDAKFFRTDSNFVVIERNHFLKYIMLSYVSVANSRQIISAKSAEKFGRGRKNRPQTISFHGGCFAKDFCRIIVAKS